jgi:hypothetical protein
MTPMMTPDPSSSLRNDGAGETDGETLGGGERGKSGQVCNMWHYG